jgi:hypothetical protein
MASATRRVFPTRDPDVRKIFTSITRGSAASGSEATLAAVEAYVEARLDNLAKLDAAGTSSCPHVTTSPANACAEWRGVDRSFRSVGRTGRDMLRLSSPTAAIRSPDERTAVPPSLVLASNQPFVGWTAVFGDRSSRPPAITVPLTLA